MFESVNYDFAVINTDVNKDGKIRKINVIYFNSIFPKNKSTPYISENGDLSFSNENMIRITGEEPDDGF